jgi:hypothetical protein
MRDTDKTLPSRSSKKSRGFWMIMVGMFVLGLIALVVLAALSDFPTPAERTKSATPH